MKILFLLISCVALSVAVGMGVVWQNDSSEKSTVTTSPPSAPTFQSAPAFSAPSISAQSSDSPWGRVGAEPALPEKKAILNDLWQRAMTSAEKLKVGDDAQDKLRKLAQTDPDVMKNLIARYDQEIDPHAKELLRTLLSTIEKPETFAFSRQLSSSNDAEQRKEGLAMLKNFSSESQEARNIVKQALATERSPTVIVEALAALKPAATADPAETETIVAQLKNLSQNADPAVRSKSLLQLAVWDKNGAGQANLSQALTDQMPEVRQAAIFAIAQSGTQSDSAKTALMAMINNASESKEVRGSALQVLERFTLNKEEQAKYSQLRTQVFGL